jgi:hypothetical protein
MRNWFHANRFKHLVCSASCDMVGEGMAGGQVNLLTKCSFVCRMNMVMNGKSLPFPENNGVLLILTPFKQPLLAV